MTVATTRPQKGADEMIRKTMWAVLAVGVALIVAPLAMGLPDKADGGQQMIDAFAPIMDEQNVQTTADYYYDVFVPLGEIAPAMSQENIDQFNAYLAGFTAVGVDAENLVPTLAQATGMSEQDVQAFMAAQFVGITAMLQQMPEMQAAFGDLLGLMEANVAVFEQVPAGLDHYEPLVTTMQEQQVNYDKVASLPDFTLFTWFFMVPGFLLVALALTGLFVGRESREADVTSESFARAA
jgi:hypothetical protein